MNMALHLVFFALGTMCVVAGVLFRPFWLSEWGPPASILLVWLTVSLMMGLGGNGKPHSVLFGVACGTIVAFGMVVTLFTNFYVGLGAALVLGCFGSRTRFFARRMEQLKTEPKVKD